MGPLPRLSKDEEEKQKKVGAITKNMCVNLHICTRGGWLRAGGCGLECHVDISILILLQHKGLFRDSKAKRQERKVNGDGDIDKARRGTDDILHRLRPSQPRNAENNARRQCDNKIHDKPGEGEAPVSHRGAQINQRHCRDEDDTSRGEAEGDAADNRGDVDEGVCQVYDLDVSDGPRDFEGDRGEDGDNAGQREDDECFESGGRVVGGDAARDVGEGDADVDDDDCGGERGGEEVDVGGGRGEVCVAAAGRGERGEDEGEGVVGDGGRRGELG